MNNKTALERERVSKGVETHKKLRASLGETEWEEQGERLLNRNDSSS